MTTTLLPYPHALNGTQLAAITDPTNLSIRIVATAS
jgi:hypothetical protein